MSSDPPTSAAGAGAQRGDDPADGPTREASPLVQRLLEENERWSETWSGDYPAAPALGVVVVACMDARVLPSQYLGIKPGEAHILRTAGGRVTDDVLRSLIASSTLLNTRSVMVVHHTECGMASTDQAGVVAAVEEAVGQAPTDIDFHTIADPLDALAEDVRRIRDCPYLRPDLEIVAGIIDVHTGELTVHIVDRPADGGH